MITNSPLTLRPFAESDLPALHSLLSDPEVMRYLEPPFDPDRTAGFLRSAGLSDPPRIYAAECGGRFIGYVIYHPYDADSVEIGWVLCRSEWGKGYAQRLTDILTEKAFAEGKSAIIECVPEQAVTRHIAGKSGFSYLGITDGLCLYRKSQN